MTKQKFFKQRKEFYKGLITALTRYPLNEFDNFNLSWPEVLAKLDVHYSTKYCLEEHKRQRDKNMQGRVAQFEHIGTAWANEMTLTLNKELEPDHEANFQNAVVDALAKTASEVEI